MKSMIRCFQIEKLRKIFAKDYEFRNHYEHRQAFQFIQPYFSTLPQSTIKMITFYIQMIANPGESQSLLDKKLEHGMLITVQSQSQTCQNSKNPQSQPEYIVVKNDKISFPNKDAFALYISHENYLSCLALGQTSIQEELQFFHSSEYLCSMPRRKYFNILRNSKVLAFTHRQVVYFEGQMISPGQSGSGVYLVRVGQMAYVKKIKNQNVQVFRFGSGHLLGTLQLEGKNTQRLFTVKCKTSRCVVYQLSQQFFTSFVKPYCQTVINKKQKKLQKFLCQKSTQIQQFREQHKQFNVSLRRSVSHNNDLGSHTLRSTQTVSMFTSRELPSLIKTSRLSSDIEAEGLRKTSYFDLRYQGPLKTYPMTSQRSKFTSSQFKDIQKLTQKNEKISKIRSIKNNATDETRESILFKLFQTSWKFQKQKKNRLF